MKIRRSKADDLFSRYIRTRDNWTCRRCEKRFEKGAQGLHAAHLYSRRHWSTRHWTGSPDVPSNALALCFHCHQYTGENPVVFAKWLDDLFGEEAMDRLYHMSHTVQKKTEYEERLRVVALGEMLARLEAV